MLPPQSPACPTSVSAPPGGMSARSLGRIGRRGRVRTYDPLVPNQMRYQLRYTPIVLERGVGIEPTTGRLETSSSTAELSPQFCSRVRGYPHRPFYTCLPSTGLMAYSLVRVATCGTSLAVYLGCA